MTRYLMIFWFIVYCLKHGVNPWWFFQLNAGYFNRKKGIYSKQDINQLIPQDWRLNQSFDHSLNFPETYPVFVKPEWGQNSYGIYRADSAEHLKQIRQVVAQKNLPYLLQEAARETREFEIFYIRDASDPETYGVLSITEVRNSRQSKFPINGVHNLDSSYRDRTADFSIEQRNQIWQHLNRIGGFWITRIGVKSDSETDLVEGRFHIVEINLFTPMPLNLLDPEKSQQENYRFVKTAMFHLSKCSKVVSARKSRENIFFNKLKMHYRVKSNPVTIPNLEPAAIMSSNSGQPAEALMTTREFRPVMAVSGSLYEEPHQLEQI